MSISLNASAYQYQLAIQEDIKSICRPLSKIGIKYFCYIKSFQDGKYLLFLNNLDYIKSHLETIKEAGDFFTGYIPTLTKDRSFYNFFPSNLNGTNQKQNPILHLAYEFNMWNMFLINKGSDSNYIRIYGFAGERSDIFLYNLCMNYIEELEGFCRYFDETAAHLIDCKDQTKLAYLEQQFIYNETSKEQILAQTMEDFLREIQIKRNVLETKGKIIPLSRREIDCLNYLALGKTAKEIAKALDLSNRTIEYYLQNLRRKSGLKRGELLSSFVKTNCPLI